MWSHDENREINDWYAKNMLIRCSYCNALNHKYMQSHYTGGMPCVLLSRYCEFCGRELKNEEIIV